MNKVFGIPAKHIKLSVATIIITFLLLIYFSSAGRNSDPPRNGYITGKSVVAGCLSLLVWPGIGQAINNDKGEKVMTHAVIGILPPYRFWSGYDALMNRKGGYWDGKI